MAVERPYTDYTAEQYLALDLESEHVRLEYDRGVIYAMAGASRDHILITSNINTWFSTALKSRNCVSYPAEMKVALPNEAYFYPDVVVTCGKEEYEHRPAGILVLLNPMIVVEVSSSSTVHLDRTRKYEVYTSMPSVQHYLIVAQDVIRVTHHRRLGESWSTSVYTYLSQSLNFGELGQMLVADIYDKVSWIQSGTTGG
jgi:Uma2 family endonuclease